MFCEKNSICFAIVSKFPENKVLLLNFAIFSFKIWTPNFPNTNCSNSFKVLHTSRELLKFRGYNGLATLYSYKVSDKQLNISNFHVSKSRFRTLPPSNCIRKAIPWLPYTPNPSPLPPHGPHASIRLWSQNNWPVCVYAGI